MNQTSIHSLNQLNAQFYRENAAPFDSSRNAGWPGWDRIRERIDQRGSRCAFALLDIACGNMRFEKYLHESYPHIDLRAMCIDSCDELAHALDGCSFHHEDIVASLAKDQLFENHWGSDFDMVVSFGFFHHIPGCTLRAHLLEALIDAVKPAGLVAISLWRFASEERMREKAERTTAEALSARYPELDLDEGDYLLGWNDMPGVFRYCHSFADSEIDHLVSIAASRADLVDRFRSDGRTNSLNEYLVFQKHFNSQGPGGGHVRIP